MLPLLPSPYVARAARCCKRWGCSGRRRRTLAVHMRSEVCKADAVLPAFAREGQRGHTLKRVARHGRCRLLFRLGVQHITRQLHASLGLSLSGMQRCSHKRTGCRHKRTGNLPYGTLLVLRIRLQMESGFRSACCATTPPPSAGWPRARPSRPSCTCCAAQSGASLTLLEGPICNRYITALSRSTNCP